MRTIPARTADQLSLACVVLGGASIVGSIATWAAAKGEAPEDRAHAERFGIFVGLWAPTFLGLGSFASANRAAAVTAPEPAAA